MLTNGEHEFTEFVMTKLRESGFETKREVSVYPHTEVDILAEKDDERQAIEIAASSEKILDAVGRASQMRRFPDVDTAYVAIAEGDLNEDVSFLAQQLGVGIITVSTSGIQYKTRSNRIGASIGVGVSLPQPIRAGTQFDFSVTLANSGGKILTQIVATCFAAFPFQLAKETSNTRTLDELHMGASKTVSFSAIMDSGAIAGSYPLIIKVSAYRVAPVRTMFYAMVQRG